MLKEYLEPQMEIITLDVADIITSSVGIDEVEGEI